MFVSLFPVGCATANPPTEPHRMRVLCQHHSHACFDRCPQPLEFQRFAPTIPKTIDLGSIQHMPIYQQLSIIFVPCIGGGRLGNTRERVHISTRLERVIITWGSAYATNICLLYSTPEGEGLFRPSEKKHPAPCAVRDIYYPFSP